jgi:hypothetical protein
MMQAFAVENHHGSTTRAKTLFVQVFKMIVTGVELVTIPEANGHSPQPLLWKLWAAAAGPWASAPLCGVPASSPVATTTDRAKALTNMDVLLLAREVLGGRGHRSRVRGVEPLPAIGARGIRLMECAGAGPIDVAIMRASWPAEHGRSPDGARTLAPPVKMAEWVSG